ncbi:NAD(P)/FAD-dependent oxidoreductase [Rhizobium sp. Leaf262]|uniref:NAD(P)-binding domain-containing protein n=1 Tax=Rhizobium sp. Leaf262 TaxID=1736312 RepID=UPI0007141544|nr:NAD(P)/FAD-dependent oxidoreductase [Rhizobium sp. Leaf262]KQO83315.1 FAD-dependent oxidoreductase [Rhizobium sp. Leaf262]
MQRSFDVTDASSASAAGLANLEQRLAEDLSFLELPPKEWVPVTTHDGQRVYDTVVIGAGMCGLVAAASLKMLGIRNVVCLDRAPKGLEGPWVTYARMETLRSPKQLTGPALGLSALTFRAWFVAQFGTDAWDGLGKIPKGQWMDYLVWYRKVLDLPVRNRIAVTDLEPLGDALIAVTTNDLDSGSTERIYARHVVLATGRDGLGSGYVPPFVEKIDRQLWAHSAADIDFAALKGKHIAVVGAGASAMDNAATALEMGAAGVDMIIRRKDLPRINKFTGISSQGVVHGFAGLSDDWKWKFLQHTLGAQTPPPRDSTLRVSRHPNGRFFLGTGLNGAHQDGRSVVLETARGDMSYDFVIFATGFTVDLAKRPELTRFASQIRFWSDVFDPAAGMENGELATSPYLGPDFEFTEKAPGSSPALRLIHCFNYPASLSHGKLSGDIPAVSDGGRRLARGIARSLFVADRQTHFDNLVAYETPELLGDEWTDSAEMIPSLMKGAAE